VFAGGVAGGVVSVIEGVEVEPDRGVEV